jgi:hypothetical protein
MMADTLDLRNALFLDRFSEFLDGRGVVAAAKHEILPDEDAELITGIIEDVLFPDTTTPDSGIKCQLPTWM